MLKEYGIFGFNNSIWFKYITFDNKKSIAWTIASITNISFFSIIFKVIWKLLSRDYFQIICKLFNHLWLTYIKLIIEVRDQNLLMGTK